MKDAILKLRKEGKTYNEIVNDLGCSKSTVSYYCTKENNNAFKGSPTDVEITNFQNLYDKYGSTYKVAEKTNWSVSTIKKYVTVKRREKESKEERRRKQVIAVSKRRRKLKELAVEYKGNNCERCGYNKCIDALEFHHLDPQKKSFSIGNKGKTIAWKKIKNELDKCIMVCSNCHKEIHYELRNE
jgi:predicted transcriptional regulator